MNNGIKKEGAGSFIERVDVMFRQVLPMSVGSTNIISLVGGTTRSLVIESCEDTVVSMEMFGNNSESMLSQQLWWSDELISCKTYSLHQHKG